MRTARGNALFAALLVLLLASVATLLALQVGVFAQRASGHATRERIVAEIAEAAVAQGAEHVRAEASVLDDASRWRPCAALAEPTQFPCGAAADASRMSYWSDDGAGDRDGDGDIDLFDARMLPLTEGRIARVGAFEHIASGAGLVAEASQYTVVGVARLIDDDARATIAQTFVRAPVYTPDPRQPPVLASGPVDLREPLHVVANSNAGGEGVAVSAWSRHEMQSSASNRCHAGAFFDQGDATLEAGIAVCDACRCPASDALTHDLARDPFPCDLFAQVFGVAARVDVDGDGFCETRAPMVSFVAPATMARVALAPDDAFLYRHAQRILSAGGDPLARPAQHSNAIAGLVWCRQACDVGAGEQLGTPARPVLFVVDGPVRIRGRVFGMVFARDVDHALGVEGGRASVQLDAGAILYGAVVAQGPIEHAGGPAAIVFAPEVLATLGATVPLAHAPVPGAWSDRVVY